MVSTMSRISLLGSATLAVAAGITTPAVAEPTLMAQAVADCISAWERFWTAKPPPGDDGELYAALSDLAREAQSRVLEAPITNAADAVLLLRLARWQFVTWESTGCESGDLDWQCFERACEYLGAGGEVPFRA